MTKTTPTWGYSAKDGAKLFELEEGQELPTGFHSSPKEGDLKDGAVTPPGSTSLRQVPAPKVPDSEKDFSENPNDGEIYGTPTTYPHILGDTDIHADDENHDGIDRRRPPEETFNKPITPPDTTGNPDDELTAITAAEDKAKLDAYAKAKGYKLDKRKNFADMLDEYHAQLAR